HQLPQRRVLLQPGGVPVLHRQGGHHLLRPGEDQVRRVPGLTESVPASTVPGSGKLETTVLSMSKTKVGKYQAFQLTQAVTLSESPGFSLTLNTLVTVEGTDVFTIVDLSGTNDPVSTDLMLKLVNRVKKLR